jgi:ribosomal-protein-alanine N-acetyltransferase
MMGGIILETERLSLREITEDDLDDLLEIWGDPETMRFFPRTLDSQAMREWIERNQRRYELYGHGLWATTMRSEQKLVGDCGLVIQEVDGIEELEVGYHFNRKYWGRGFATEAARACMDYTFERLGRRRVISMIRPENSPSRRVAERNGLRIEKEILWHGYPHYVYAIELNAR